MAQTPENSPRPSREEETQPLAITIGFTEDQGRRISMEDANVIKTNFGGKTDQAFFAIYDGHRGREAADFAANKLDGFFLDQWVIGTPAAKALHHAYIETDKLCRDIKSGTCALTVFMKEDTLFVANAGDSRAVLDRAGKAKRLSQDHRAGLKAESTRIKAAGGKVIYNFGTYRVNGTLMVSRAIGDADFGKLVPADPYIRKVDLKPNDSRLIMACDGVWDEIPDQKAVILVKTIDNPQEASMLLRDEALKRGSHDNLSVIVVDFDRQNKIILR